MISCPITQLPLENFYKYVFRAIKDRLGNDKTFDVNDFMEKLFEESVKNADPETAAKWLQSTPRVINLIITKSFSNKIPLVKGLENIYGLMDDFSKPNGEGFQNVLKKYIKPVDTKDLKGEAAHQLSLEFSDEEEEGPEDEKKETNPRVEARLKTPVVMSGTLQSFVPVDPSRKTDTYSERLDKPRAQILTNLAILGDALSMQDPFDGEFTYQGKKVKVKATNLYAFAQQNFNDLDPTTQQEIKDSNFYTSTGRNQPGVTQIDKRVILVITDETGQNLYFDTEGNLTTKGNGTLVYQFMRDVRQTSKGYTVTDIYGREEQLMPADTYAQLTYDEKIDGDYATYLEKVKDDREKELKRLFQIRENALANDMILEFSGLSAGVTSDLTATKLPLSDFLKIPGATKKNLKGIRTLKKAEGNFEEGRAVINLNGTDFQVNRSSMPDSVADQIAAVMFDPNIPFETKKDFYSQFIPEDSTTKLAYTMRKHEIIPDMVNQSFRIKIYDKVGDKYGFVTEPIFDFVISKAVLDKSSKEKLEKGIKTFSDTLKTGRANGKATYMSYKSDLLNNEEYLTYNSNTKQIEIANYIDFLSTLDGYVDLFNGDPGFYNKHLLFNEENTVEKEIKKASGAASQTFEEALEESIKLAAERKALEDANKSPIEIEAKVIADRALSPEFRAQLAQQGMEGKYDTYYYLASLIQAINNNSEQRYTREFAEQLRDIFAGAKYINGKQVDTINDIINRAFPKAEGPLQREVEIIQKTVEPEMPDPTTSTRISKNDLTQDEQDTLDEFGELFRAGYIADEIGEEDTAKVLDWWNNTELGKELQKHIELQHAYNLVNSDVFARFVVTGATLANPDIKGKIQINKGIGTLVDTYHEAWHGFTQLFLTRKEKYGLYDEVINYKDASGKQPYKSMDYKAVDELLAEDFRTYMKSNYIKKGSPLRNKLFRKIMNFIRSLFGKKAINPTEVITDVMNVPAVRELFEKLNYSSNKKSFVRSYKANMDNVDFMVLNRGISKLNRPSDSALSDQDSRLVSDSMDMIISDIIDDYYKAKVKTGKTDSLKSGTIGLLLDPEKREKTYTIILKRLQKKLDQFKDQLHSQEGITPFSQIEKLDSANPNDKTIESEAVAVLRSNKGEDKYVFLKSQIDGFDNLDASMRRGTRVRGESWHGIKIVGDFYSHKSIKKGKKPVGIIVVSSLEDAQVQFDNYVAGGAQEYTSFEVKDVPDYMLSAEQEFVLDNVRILQAAVDNFGDPQWDLKGIEPTGTIAYHLENSDFDLSKKKYELDVFEVDENGDEIDEDQENETHDSETPFGGEPANKKSLMQLADKEVIYILKSLHKVDRNGNVGYNRLGFKERADFKKVWNIVTKAIGGVRDRVKVYEILMAEAENFPEIAQLIETKFPDPRLITNTFEVDVSNSFWQTFAKPSVKYWQFTVFPQYEPGTNFLTGESEDILKGFEADVTQSSIEVDSTIRKFESIFKSSVANDYIEKNADNQSTLKLDEVIKAFENEKYPGQLDISKAFEFAAALGMKLDALPVIKKNIQDRAEYFGLPYIYDIIKDFADIQKSNKSTEQQLEYLNKFVSNPVGTLRGEIPKGILKSFKKEVAEKNILKRIAELQSQYGYDSANPGILLPDGNRVFENVNHSQVTVTVDAINNVENLSDFWSKPALKFMSHLKPGKSFFTLRSKVLGAMFDTAQGTFDRKGTRSLELLQTAGTQIADMEGVNTSDLDKLGKFFQEFHTMTLGGIAEFIRHAEKKSAFGIKLLGGKMKVIVNGITNGVDQNLYIDINKFVTKPGDKISDGEIVAVGGYFLDYIAAEFDRIRYFKQNPQDLKSIKGYNREIKDENDKVIGMAGEFFSAFDNILRAKTKKDLYALASDPLLDLPTHIRNNQGLYLQIQKDIADYFTEKTESMYNDYFKDLPYVDVKVYEKAGIETKGDISDESKKAVLKSYLFNDWIHKFEMFNLFNGDLSQFNHDKQQASKRAPGSTSDGDGFVNDKYMHEFINKVFNKNTYAKKLAKETGLDLDKFVMNGTLNTGVIADAERKSIYLDEMLESWKEQYTAALTPLYTDKTALKKEIDRRLAKDAKAYKKMTESDGAAFMTFDAYRTLKKQGNSWGIPQEALYQQIIAGEQVDPLKVKEFFPIYKLHYYGSIDNAPIATTGMHKFAVAPIIPTIAVKGTELYNLHVKMMKENLQYVAFGSGSKVATLTMTGEFDNIFGDETQKTVSADAPIRKNVIYLEYLKDVTKVASKLKKEISYPTQKRVLLLDGLFNVGDVINKANVEIANDYKAAVNDYTETLALDLLNKIGYEYDPKTKKYIGKLDKFIELIRDELGAKEVPEHLIKLLDTTLSDQLSMDFSIHPEADMLEKVIVNRIQKSIIKQKTKGESMVQAPSTFYNGVWDSAYQRDEAIKANDELIRKYLGSNNLPFYTRGKLNADGTRQLTSAMKVAIPMNGDFLNILKLKHPDGELIGTTDRLNELIKNDEWLDENRELITIVGPRIPTDAANSMEFAEVWHFLDASAGNTVIVPTEIVAKAGSDFDVDKIFFMLPNINSDGTLTKAPAENLEELTKMVKEANSVSKKVRKEKGLPNPQALIDQYKKAAQNKLIKSTRDILSLPDNHASLTKPNNTYLVEDEVEFYDKYSRGYNNKKNAHDEPVRMNGDKEVMSPSRSLDNDYNLSQHEAMLSGNMPLGIMAKKNKVHALFKSVGAVMPLSYNATVWNDETKKYDEIPAQYDVVVRMEHNKTMSGAVSLSNQNNVDGEKIGDIFSHGLQGLLDRANNPFPFKLQIVKEALGTINHLIEAGVSVPEVFAFISNPWIVDYIQKQMYYGGSMAKLQDAPVASHQVKSTAFRETVASLVSAGGEEMKKIVNQIANYANDRRMMDIADMLKQKDQDKVYIIKTKDAEGEEVLKKATGKRIFHSNDFPVDQIIELKEFEENTDYDSLKTLFKRSGGIANNDNFYYASEALWNRAFPGSSTVSKDTLQSLVMGGHNPNIQNLAILMHMLQLEKQFKGMDELEMAFSPDTGLMDTTLQIKKRDDAFKLFDETSKIDSNFLERLRNNSILSSFYKSGLIMDLVVPLFPLRLNETISKFVEKKIDQTRDMIVQKFGPGVKGKERFINMYNNAVVNYIFQNTRSNSLDENGSPVTLPESAHSLPIKEVTTGPAVSFTDKDVKVNLEQARKDFDARIFLSSNNTPEGNRAKNLDTFDAGENPFPNFASYVKFAIEKEYLKTVNTKESLAKNKDFKKLSFQSGSEDLGYDKYITQMALMNSFNRAFIMGTTKYSYTGMVMDIINEFEDQNIKDNFPVLAQLAPAKFTKDVNVLELNDKATAKGAIADDYYKNLKQLADPTVRKVVSTDKEMQKIDNNRITEVFKNFSMLMYYQHGTGYSKLGFVKVLDPEAFTKIMQNAANSFLNNDLSEKTLERIYNRLNAKSQFKDYTVNPNNMDEEESVEDYLSTFSEEDFGDMSDFLEGVPTQPAANVDDFDTADKLTPIEQNFADGQGGRQMQPQFKGKSTMDLIISGDRTRTTRANTDIQRMAKDYGLSKISDLVGKVIRMTDKTGRQVYTRITQVTPFTQEYQDQTWQKEGWVKSVTDKHVGNYPYAIEFEVVNRPTQPSTSNLPGPETKINIYSSTGENAELSNFADRPFKLGDGTTYPTVEHAFQLEKLQYSKAYTEDQIDTIVEDINKKSAAQAKAFGGTVKGLDTQRWDADSSINMKILIKSSFEQNPDALAKLLATGNATLTHTQDKTKWGTEFPKLLMEVRDELRNTQPSTQNQPTGLSTYTNHSGGAAGSDTEWDVIGKEFGMINNKHYYTGVRSPKNAPLGNVDITDEPIAVEGARKVAQAAKQMWGYKYNAMTDKRLIRNWAQVANSDAVFAISTLGKEGDIWKGDEKSAEPRRLLKFAVQGGTGYAVEMAIQAGKPVYVFDQVRDQWYKNIDGEWSKSEVPVLTKNFAGIGTREINEAGKQAIKDVYENTLGEQTEKPLTVPQIIASGASPYRGRFAIKSQMLGTTDYVESDVKLSDAIKKAMNQSTDDAISAILGYSLKLLDPTILDRNIFVSRDRYKDDSAGTLGVSAALEFLGLRRTDQKGVITKRQLQTMAHELTHMMTLQPFIKESDNVPLTAKEKEFLTEMRALYNYVKALPESKNFDYYNPMLNEFEFIADALADPKFREYLNSIEYSKGKSVLTKLIEMIKGFLGVKPGSALETVVEQVYSLREDSDFKHYDTLHHLVDEMTLRESDRNLKQISQTTEGIPKGQEVVPGVYVNQGALTQDEQMELFDYLKPYLEEQAAKTNKGNNASKMIGLGLRWDYKSNNVGRAAINIPDVINPGNKTKYGYYDVSINDQPLGQITPRFKELMQKATGVDMTNYDGAIINLYENDSFISSHNDVDESRSAIQYPVIGINIGGKGNFSIERIPGAGELSLEAGTGYVFGVDGVNREVWHRTFPTKQDTFLPELTTRIDGKTYPAGSYRVTITMRRVEPLLPGMPIAPVINAQQLPVQTVAGGSTVIISEFYNGLTEAQKKILGNLEDLIAEYDEIPFDYSEEKYIESLKCKL